MERPTDQNLPAPLNRALIQRDPFNRRPVEVEWQPGDTLAQIIGQAGVCSKKAVRVSVSGHMIANEYLHVARPKPGALIEVSYIPQGGDNTTLRTVAMIALAVGAPYAGAAAGSLFAGGAFYSTTAAAIGTAAVFTVGMLAVNALLPIQENFENGDASSQSLSVQPARNRFEPYGTINTVLGNMRLFPKLAATSYSELVGDDQYVTMLLSMGYKNLEVDRASAKLGDDLLSTFTDTQLEYVTGSSDDDPALTLYTNAVTEEAVNIKINGNFVFTPWRTTADGISRFNVDIYFPYGLFRIPSSGGTASQAVDIRVEYRVAGSGGAWSNFDTHISAATRSSFRRTLEGPLLGAGQYEVRVAAHGDICDPGPCQPDGQDNPAYNLPMWQTLRSLFDETPVCDQPCLGLANLRIKATDQLSGTPDIFNIECTSRVPDWTGAAWVEAPTNNPASLIRWILTTDCLNARALPVSRLDDASFQGFHDWCAAEGFTYNRVVDSRATVIEICSDIATAGRGRLLQIDSQWTIIWDTVQALTRQYFTPRNTISYSSEKLYPEEVHAYRARFISEVEQWKNSERTVYWDGFDGDSAEKFESMTPSVGITNPDHLWKAVRYWIKVAELQREVHTIEVDLEHILVVPGDRVTWQEDSLLIGVGNARVEAFTGGSVTLDAAMSGLDVSGSTQYAITIRHKDGTADTFNVDTPTQAEQVVFTGTVPAGTALDDLALFGVAGQISQDLLVRDILPGANMSARLICVPYDERIYDVDSEIPPTYNPVVTPPIATGYPQIVSVRSGADVMTDPESPVIVVGVVPVGDTTGAVATVYEWRLYEGGTNEGPWLSQTVGMGQDGQLSPVIVGSEYEIRVSYAYSDGRRSQFATTTHTVVGWVATLPDPTSHTISLQGDLRTHDWAYTPVPTWAYGYEIRYMREDQAASIPVNIYTEDSLDVLTEDSLNINAEYTDPTAPDWQQMTKLVDTMITLKPYTHNLVPVSGTAPPSIPANENYLWAVKLVDAYGNESVNPAYTEDNASTVAASVVLLSETP